MNTIQLSEIKHINNINLADLTNRTNSITELNVKQQTIINGGKRLIGACTRTDDGEAACAGFGQGLFIEPWDYPADFPYQDGFKFYDDNSFESLH